MKDPLLLSTGDVAELCQVTTKTVQRWIDRGLLQSYKLPGRGDNRIRKQDFLNFLSTQQLPIPEQYKPVLKKVLIVDDDLSMAKSLQRILIQDGFETVIANNGFSAGALLAGFAPTIMTLDLQMPGMNGFEVIRYVRETPKFTHLKILVVSGLEESELARSIRSGANDAMQKPIVNELFLKKMRNLFGD